MKTTDVEISIKPKATQHESWLDVVQRQVGSLRFGVVQIVVHEKRVVQIERTEKVRFAGALAVSQQLT
jgi:hypothetical protein